MSKGSGTLAARLLHLFLRGNLRETARENQRENESETVKASREVQKEGMRVLRRWREGEIWEQQAKEGIGNRCGEGVGGEEGSSLGWTKLM